MKFWTARDGNSFAHNPNSFFRLLRTFGPGNFWTGRLSRKSAVVGSVLACSVMLIVPSIDYRKYSLLDIAHASEKRNATVMNFPDIPVHKSSNKHLSKAMNYTFVAYTLGEVIPLTKDVALFRFLLPEADSSLDLHPCVNIEARFYSRGKFREGVTRHYTPVTTRNAKGYFDIIVRKRSKGMMTEHFFGLLPGDELEFRLSASKLKYKPNKWKEVGMICGGTGLTPMLQILRYALDSENGDNTKFSMVYSNRSEDHIPLKSYLDDLAVRFPQRFQVKYGVDVPNNPDDWNGFVGFTSCEDLDDCMPAPSKDNVVLVCGPDEFVGHLTGAVKPILAISSKGKYIQPLTHGVHRMANLSGELHELGYKPENVYVF